MFAEIKINLINDLPTPFGKTLTTLQKKICASLIERVNQMLTVHTKLHELPTDLKRDLNRKRVAIINDQIDALVYELYGLTAEEIAIIERDT
jgi:hypothetical protein